MAEIKNVNNEFEFADLIYYEYDERYDREDFSGYNRLVYSQKLWEAALCFYRHSIDDGVWEDIPVAVNRVKNAYDELCDQLFIVRSMADEDDALRRILSHVR